MDRLSEPAASPDGSAIVFTVSALDAEANRRRTDLWWVKADGTRPAPAHRRTRPATRAPSGSPTARASSSCRRAPARRRCGRWTSPRASRNAGHDAAARRRRVPCCRPTGRTLAVALEVFVDCDTLECTSSASTAKEKSKATGQVYDRLFIRHWDTWKDGRRSHLFVVPVAGGDAGGRDEGHGRRRAVEAVRRHARSSPSRPTARALVFTARDAGREEAWSTNFDLYVAPDRRQRAAAQPDGRQQGLGHGAVVLARRQDARLPRDGARRLRGRPLPHRRARLARRRADASLTEAWDRSPNELVWSADGKTIYTTADNVGQKSLFAIDVATRRREDASSTRATSSRPVLLGAAARVPARPPASRRPSSTRWPRTART